MLKLFGIKIFFPIHPPRKRVFLYTQLKNIDSYGRPLNVLYYACNICFLSFQKLVA